MGLPAMMEAIISVDMKDGWVKAVCEGTGRPIRILDCMPHPEGGGHSLFEIEAKENEIDSVTEQIKAHPDVQNVQLTSLGGGRAKGSLVTKKCFACRTIMESDCFLRGAQTKEDGTVEWDIVLTSEGALALLSEKLQRMGCKVKVLRLAQVEDDAAMTMRQEEIVRKAFEMGYYDYPRRTTVREMAVQMKVAPSTLTEILQRGERNIIERHLRESK
jgi:predicted DNA binding protein